MLLLYIFSQIKIKKISLKSDTRFYPFTLFFIQFYSLKILNYISIIIIILTPLTDQSVKLSTDKLKSARNGKIPTGKINKKIIIPRKISKDPLKLSRINLETFLLRRIYPSPAPIGSTAGLRIVWIIDGGRGKRGLASTRNKKQDGGHVERADVCAQGGMAAHWSTFGALQRWRGRTGATGGGLQVREGGEGREETNPRGVGAIRFLSFPRSSREEFAFFAVDLNRVAHVPASRWERERVRGLLGILGFEVLFSSSLFFSSVFSS